MNRQLIRGLNLISKGFSGFTNTSMGTSAYSRRWPRGFAAAGVAFFAPFALFALFLSATHNATAAPIDWTTDTLSNPFNASTIATPGGQTFAWTSGSLSGTVTVRLLSVTDGTVVPSASGTSFQSTIDGEFIPIAEYSFTFNGVPGLTLEVSNTLALAFNPDRVNGDGDPEPGTLDSHEWTTQGDDWSLALSGPQIVLGSGTGPDNFLIEAADNTTPFSNYTGVTTNLLEGGVVFLKQKADFNGIPSSSLQGIQLAVLGAIPEPATVALMVAGLGLIFVRCRRAIRA